MAEKHVLYMVKAMLNNYYCKVNKKQTLESDKCENCIIRKEKTEIL